MEPLEERMVAAGSHFTDPVTLDKLGDDPSRRVRLLLADNPGVPDATLARLRKDPDEGVRQIAGLHPLMDLSAHELLEFRIKQEAAVAEAQLCARMGPAARAFHLAVCRLYGWTAHQAGDGPSEG